MLTQQKKIENLNGIFYSKIDAIMDSLLRYFGVSYITKEEIEKYLE